MVGVSKWLRLVGEMISLSIGVNGDIMLALSAKSK